MADSQTKPQVQINYPTRNIVVTGERVARLTQTAVRVSRLEQRLIQLSMAGSTQIREAIRRTSDSFDRAYSDFEAQLKAIENDLDMAGRSSGQRTRGKAKPQGTQKQILSRSGSAKGEAKAEVQPQASKQGGDQKIKAQRSENTPKPAEQKAKPQASKPEPKPAQPVPVVEPSPKEAAIAVPADLPSL